MAATVNRDLYQELRLALVFNGGVRVFDPLREREAWGWGGGPPHPPPRTRKRPRGGPAGEPTA